MFATSLALSALGLFVKLLGGDMLLIGARPFGLRGFAHVFFLLPAAYDIGERLQDFASIAAVGALLVLLSAKLWGRRQTLKARLR